MGLYLFLTRPKVEESKPVPPKLKEEDDPNSPFFRGPRPDPPKPGKITARFAAKFAEFSINYAIFESDIGCIPRFLKLLGSD